MGKTLGDRAYFHELEFPIPAEIPHDEDSPAHLLIRPEDVVISTEPPPEDLTVLGKGTVTVEGFATAAARRARVKLSKFAHVHPSSTTPGEPDTLVLDAQIPTHIEIPESEVWVALRRWHFLNPPRPSLLVCDDGRGRATLFKIAGELAKRLKAELRILGVASDAKETAGLGARVKRRLKRAGLGDHEIHVRYGNPADQILNEQAELLSRMILMAPRSAGRRWAFWRHRNKIQRKSIGKTIVSLLERTHVPVLLVDGAGTQLKRIVVLFDPSFAGARFLRMSARLAHQLDARVTVLEAADGRAAPPPAEGLARQALKRLGENHEIHSLSRGASDEATASWILELPADLVVVPVARDGPRRRNQIDSLVQELLSRTRCTVLVIPTERGE